MCKEKNYIIEPNNGSLYSVTEIRIKDCTIENPCNNMHCQTCWDRERRYTVKHNQKLVDEGGKCLCWGCLSNEEKTCEDCGKIMENENESWFIESKNKWRTQCEKCNKEDNDREDREMRAYFRGEISYIEW